MTGMNFEFAHKQLALIGGRPPLGSRRGQSEPVHRPSVALILLATTVQIIAMGAILGSVANTVQ